MGEKEIIRALECCGNQSYSCTDKLCKAKVMGEAVELIKRQKAEKEALIAGQETLQKCIAEKNAEIERYKGVIKLLEKDVQTAKDEAYKEVAERLKQRVITVPLCQYEEHGYKAVHYEIDDIVKELTEVKNNG